jgi:hypothetical protein
MNFKLIFTAIASVFAAISAASAGDLADACTAALEADGRDASGCTCLEEEVVANDLVDEFLALGEIADPDERYASASDDAKAAMDKCTR